MKKQVFFFVLICVCLWSCKNDVDTIVNVKLNPSFLTLTESSNKPMNVKGDGIMKTSVLSYTDSIVFAVQIYENDVPCFYGLFNDVSKMQLALSTSKSYRFKIAAYKTATGKGLKSIRDTAGLNYFLPNKTPLKNTFLRGDALKSIDLASSIILNGQSKTYPEVDVFYSTKSLTIDKGINIIDFNMLRMGFGANLIVDGLNSGSLDIYIGNDTIKLNSSKNTAFSVRQFNTATNNFNNIFKLADTFGDTVAITAKWTGSNGAVVIATGKYKFLRNYQKTININLNASVINFEFENWATESVTDADGNFYHTIKIGSQTWLVENLRTTHYRNGDNIQSIQDNSSWSSTKLGALCAYKNMTNVDTIAKYGMLYNWHAVNDNRKIAPTGWHVSTENDWKTLIKYLSSNGYNYDGTISNDSTTSNKLAKSIAGNSTWFSASGMGAIGNNLATNNKSGFSATPSIYRKYTGDFYTTEPSCAIFWTSSIDNVSGNPFYWSISYAKSFIYNSTNPVNYGFAVRCVKD
jgi:uncharacterized protein (TIGR02145 family)